MSQTNRNLWGDIDAPGDDADINPVVALLEEQAEVLAELTRGQVRAEVRPTTPDAGLAGWEFRLRAALADYSYALLRVDQHALDFPVTLHPYTADEAKPWPYPTRAAFEAALGQVLKSEPTRKALASVRAINRLDGARLWPIDFSDEGGEPRAGSMVVWPLHRGRPGGEWRRVTVVDGQGLALEARVFVGAAVNARQGEDEQINAIRGAVSALLARGVRYDPEGETPSIELTTKGAQWVDGDGAVHPL